MPEGLIDPQVAVIRFDRPDGGAIGAILAYSCHPTASGLGIPSNVSADFVGHGRTAIEGGGYEGTCVFLQGCAGNQGTGKWVSGTAWDDTVAMGERFARGVAEALRTAAPVTDGGLLVARSSLPLELDPFPPARRAGGRVRARRPRHRVRRHRLDRRPPRPGPPPDGARSRTDRHAVDRAETSRWSCCRARSSSSTASRCAPDRPFANTVVAAYNDNTLQYIPTAAAFPDGEYEVDGGWRYIQAGQGERMAAEAVRLLGGLRA